VVYSGFVARTSLEPGPDRQDHLTARAMTWRADLGGPVISADDVAHRILTGLTQAGVHRALIDLDNLRLLKWLDDPCPFYDWRRSAKERPQVHPDDEDVLASMTKEFIDGATTQVLRMRGFNNDWVPVHVTVDRVELEPDTFAGLVSLRLPTDEEVAGAGLPKASGDGT
jgi:hypothetical protein